MMITKQTLWSVHTDLCSQCKCKEVFLFDQLIDKFPKIECNWQKIVILSIFVVTFISRIGYAVGIKFEGP